MTIYAKNEKCLGGPGCNHKVTFHWNDSCRRSQVNRFAELETQNCDREAQGLRQQILEQVKLMPEHVRVDVPSVRAISRILGMFRTAATVKKDPMRILEMSAQEIAKVINYGKTQVEAALRWLGVGEITYRGAAVAMGLGVIERQQRKGRVTICGKMRGVFRTSTARLTGVGRSLLGIFQTAKKSRNMAFDKDANKREQKTRRIKARCGALDKIKKALRTFWDDAIAEPPLEFAASTEVLNPFQREFMERARLAVERGKATS